MKKVFAILISLALLMSVAIAPVYAGGGKVQGDEGQGTVSQGDNGSDEASPGDDAMGNQVD
jgi:opacity protein-like surface antigen